VNAVAYSPDGSRLASGSWDRTVKVWDAIQGTEFRTLRGHTAIAAASAFSPDGSRLASASWDQTVKLWDTRSGLAVATLRGHTGHAISVAYSPDGLQIASAAEDQTIKVWDARSGLEVATLRGHSAAVNGIAFSPDGSRLASASWDRTIKVWDRKSATTVATLEGHSAMVLCVAYSPNGARIASGSWDTTVKLWDTKASTEVKTLRGHTLPVVCVAFSPDSSRVVTASLDQTVKVWDVGTGAVVATLRGHTIGAVSVAYSLDGSRLASASPEQAVKVWDTQRWTEVVSLRGHTAAVTSVTFSPDGSRLASTDASGKVFLWEAAPTRPPNQLLLDASWEGDMSRHRLQAPLWHAGEADVARNRGDSFAESFQRRQLAHGDNLRLLAWARLAAGDQPGCREAIRSLREQHQAAANVAVAWPLFSALSGGAAFSPALARCAMLPVTMFVHGEQVGRAAELVRAAALMSDSGIASHDLVALARTCVAGSPQGWQGRELLDAALLRDGKATEAVKELDEAARAHGEGSSLWTRLFLALAHQRLGHVQEADDWQKKADKAGPWEEQVMQLHLLGELERAKRPPSPELCVAHVLLRAAEVSRLRLQMLGG
jgi:WD40 repeat protein